MWPGLKLSDEDLVRRFSESGEPAIFDELFRRYHKHVYLTCYGILRNQALAQDLSQETFRKAFAHLTAARPAQLGGWLGRIARNLCLDCLRSARHHFETLPLDEMDGSTQQNESEDAAIAACDVRSVLRRLRPEHRICLNLLYVHHYSYDEIGARLGVDVKQVKSYVQNAKERFRALYEAKTPTTVDGASK
jgi:RNA polymerase sigma-70 factor (ECF subfamily)